MRWRAQVACAALALSACAPVPTATPDLGRVITNPEISAWDLTVAPDGSGLPTGTGTVALGQQVYEQKCVACHGVKGRGGPFDTLVGGRGTLTGANAPLLTVGSYWPYATTVFDYVRRAMPLQQPKSLTDDEVYAVTAYILYLNGIIDEQHTLNSRALPAVVMPNRNGFEPLWP